MEVEEAVTVMVSDPELGLAAGSEVELEAVALVSEPARTARELVLDRASSDGC